MDERQRESPGQDNESLTPKDTSASSADSQKTDEALTLDTDASLPPRSRNESAGTAVMRPGTVLGTRYEILHQLGKGGMGAVYKTRDRELDRVVALKVIRTELADQPESLQRFKQELILARQVTHKNVIRIFDLGEADGIKFITMECVEGQDLRSLLKQKGKFTAQESTAIIVQVCLALAAAHAEGVVHRDLKPQNIMIDAHGKATVMDFGIAHSAEFTGMTQPGALLGTLEYMSPEQAKGQKGDERSDLYALGIILYELLTGQTPHKADTTLATLLRRTQERALPPTELDATIPRYLSDVVVKCLEIDPRLRYQRASEILADLQTGHGPRTALRLSLPGFRMAGEHPTRWVALALVTILLLIGLTVFRGRIFRHGKVMLVVLPFQNLGDDAQQEYFADGMTEETITQLGGLDPQRLGVIARTSAMQYKASRKNAAQIARELSVNYLLEGSVRREGRRIRVTAQLIQGSDQTNVWTDSYDRDVGDILKLQSEVARAIAGQIRLRLTRQVEQRLSSAPRVNAQAYEAYLQGQQAWNLRSGEGTRRGIEEFQHAVEIDPNYAAAYAGLARAYALSPVYGFLRELEAMPKARDAAARAIALDDSLAESHSMMGFVKAHYEYDWPGAEREFQLALKLNPSDPYAHLFYSNSCLSPLGRHDEAIAEMKKAIELDPFSSRVQSFLGRTYIWARRYDDALTHLQKTTQMFPGFAIDHQRLAHLYTYRGEFDKAITEETQARILAGEDPRSVVKLEDALHQALASHRAAGVLGKAAGTFCAKRQPAGSLHRPRRSGDFVCSTRREGKGAAGARAGVQRTPSSFDGDWRRGCIRYTSF